MTEPNLDLAGEAGRLATMYGDSGVLPEYYKILIYGGAGTGKTAIVPTCPLPILYHSFDRNGWITIREFAKDRRKILIDKRFEGELGDRNDLIIGKTVFELWEKEFKRLNDMNFFSLVGTYVIDSATTWALAALDTVMCHSGKTNNTGWVIDRKKTPDQKDWQVQMQAIKLALFDFHHLSCHSVFVMHETTEKDELTGIIKTEPLLTGKLKGQVPPDFDEVYRAVSRGGAKFELLTARDGYVTARSRLSGMPPRLAQYEPMDIRKILQKCGAKWQDKPLFNIGGAV